MVTAARLTSEWPGSVILLLKTFTVPVTVDVLNQKKFGGTCAVNLLSPACHVNPMLITNIYSKICDILHLQDLRVARYHNITDTGTMYLM